MGCPFYDLEYRIAYHGVAPFTTSSAALRTMGCPFYDLEYTTLHTSVEPRLSTLGYPLGC